MVSREEKSKPGIKLADIIRFVVFLAIAVLLLAFAFKNISVQSIASQIFKAKFGWVFLSFFISVVAHVIRAIRWNLLMEPLGYHPPLRKTFYAVMVGYLANLAFPRLGEVTRCGALSKDENIPFNTLLGTVIIERIIDVVSLLICLSIVTVVEFNRLSNFLNSNIIQPVFRKFHSIGSSPLMIGLLIIFLFILFLAIYFFRRKRKSLISEKITHLVKGVVEGIRSIARLKKPWLFIFHSAFIWFLYFLSVYVALFAFPYTENLDLGAALFLLVAGGIAMSAPVQGGIGAYHLLVSQGLLLFGLSQQEGLAFATLLHSLQMVITIVFGSLSLLLLFLDRKQTLKKDLSAVNT